MFTTQGSIYELFPGVTWRKKLTTRKMILAARLDNCAKNSLLKLLNKQCYWDLSLIRMLKNFVETGLVIILVITDST